MKRFLLIASLISIVACNDKPKDLIVKAKIYGLKKGVLYLKKMADSTLITVDSLVINGQSEFELSSALESPEVFYLYLDKNSLEKNSIPFFADQGITEINTTLKTFTFDAQIKGSEQQKIWEEYQLMQSRFNDSNLELIKANFEAQKEGDPTSASTYEKQFNSLLKRKYLYTVNFALNHKDSEVAPFLALTEIYNARLDLLDTINNSISEKVKRSKYGKALQTFVDDIRKNEVAN
ncbi:DUF4369 domain-containing protein [Changchengzhania lutea]|uniref:DUF4369 domain-containing protein n=1 Tax=Changchengzhania lutea TaxID=2049305 RepID=UPI00115F2158|nr:DUF4369 domain-containing protein [Changchengzhania lutea]